MTDQNTWQFILELTDEEQKYLISYAFQRLIEDDRKRRQQPSLLQPKVDRFRDERDPPHHPTYTPT